MTNNILNKFKTKLQASLTRIMQKTMREIEKQENMSLFCWLDSIGAKDGTQVECLGLVWTCEKKDQWLRLFSEDVNIFLLEVEMRCIPAAGWRIPERENQTPEDCQRHK